MSNLIKSMHEKTKEIIRDNYRQRNSLYDEKIFNYSFRGSGLFSREIVFEGIESIAELSIDFVVNASTNIEVVLNDVVIVKRDICNTINFTKFLYIGKENKLVVNINTDISNFVEFLINLKISGKKLNKNQLKLLNFDNDIILLKDGHVTKTNNIMSNIYVYNDNTIDNNDTCFDINYIFNKQTLNKNGYYAIYYNNSLKLKDYTNGIEYNLGLVVDDACILGANVSDAEYVILVLINGEIFVRKYDSNMVLVDSHNLSKIKIKNIVKVQSVVSDAPCDTFVIQDAGRYFYLVKLNAELSDVIYVRPYKNCNQMTIYYDDMVIIESHEYGVVVSRYFDTDLTEQVFFKKYLNAIDAFYYEDNIYLINSDNIQCVE